MVPPGAGAVVSAVPSGDPLPLVEQYVATAREQVRRLKGLIAPRLVVGDRPLWATFALWTLLALAGYALLSWWGVVVATAGVGVGGVGLWFALRARSRAQA